MSGRSPAVGDPAEQNADQPEGALDPARGPGGSTPEGTTSAYPCPKARAHLDCTNAPSGQPARCRSAAHPPPSQRSANSPPKRHRDRSCRSLLTIASPELGILRSPLRILQTSQIGHRRRAREIPVTRTRKKIDSQKKVWSEVERSCNSRKWSQLIEKKRGLRVREQVTGIGFSDSNEPKTR